MFTREDLMKTAALAGLLIPEEEICGLTEDMKEIVAFAARVTQAEADVSEEEQGVCSLREDVRKASYPQCEILREAGGGRDGFFCLPRVK